MVFDPHNATRPVLGAVLQTVWGVNPPENFYNPVTKEVETNFLWGIGNTPFGFFSSSSTLSFAIKDAVSRNVVLNQISDVISELIHLREHFAVSCCLGR